jgi:hypothetical protein
MHGTVQRLLLIIRIAMCSRLLVYSIYITRGREVLPMDR